MAAGKQEAPETKTTMKSQLTMKALKVAITLKNRAVATHRGQEAAKAEAITIKATKDSSSKRSQEAIREEDREITDQVIKELH